MNVIFEKIMKKAGFRVGKRYQFDKNVSFYKVDNGVIYKTRYYPNIKSAVEDFKKDLEEYYK